MAEIKTAATTRARSTKAPSGAVVFAIDGFDGVPQGDLITGSSFGT
jgi:hypothetical protein